MRRNDRMWGLSSNGTGLLGSVVTVCDNMVVLHSAANVLAKVRLLQPCVATEKPRVFNAAFSPAKLKSCPGAAQTA